MEFSIHRVVGHVTGGIPTGPSLDGDDFHAELPKKLGQGYGRISCRIITTQVHTATQRHDTSIFVCSAGSRGCRGDSPPGVLREGNHDAIEKQRKRKESGGKTKVREYVGGSGISAILARWRLARNKAIRFGLRRRSGPQANQSDETYTASATSRKSAASDGPVSSRLVSPTPFVPIAT
jgi:hypothetical protein